MSGSERVTFTGEVMTAEMAIVLFLGTVAFSALFSFSVFFHRIASIAERFFVVYEQDTRAGIERADRDERKQDEMQRKLDAEEREADYFTRSITPESLECRGFERVNRTRWFRPYSGGALVLERDADDCYTWGLRNGDNVVSGGNSLASLGELLQLMAFLFTKPDGVEEDDAEDYSDLLGD